MSGEERPLGMEKNGWGRSEECPLGMEKNGWGRGEDSYRCEICGGGRGKKIDDEGGAC